MWKSAERRKECDRKRYQRHREERLEHDRKYRLDNKEKIREHWKENKELYNKNLREARLTLKVKVLSNYCNSDTPFCIMCKEDDIDCLTIDHIDNNGAKERRTKGRSALGSSLYIGLRKEGFPTGYQTLCMNCQIKKEMHRRRELLGKN